MNWLSYIVILTFVCFIFPQNAPEEFIYEQSTLEAFYFFNTVTINGVAVDTADWVGAFNGNICLGAKKWNTLACGGGVCDIPVDGDDGTVWTAGYMQPGDIPTFKIYDASENVYLDAVASTDIPWFNMSMVIIDKLEGEISILGCIDTDACNYNPYVTEDDGSCLEYDCSGVCGGSAVVDDCGECGGTGIQTWECDCAGKVEDCAGLCGGSAIEDQCGVCNGDNDCMAIDELTISYNYNISNIYPNPFNPITTIAYSLPENTDIELIVYDIHGRQIQILAQGFQIAGSHSINWNASDYPSGIYLIKLESIKYIETQKVVLIK